MDSINWHSQVAHWANVFTVIIGIATLARFITARKTMRYIQNSSQAFITKAMRVITKVSVAGLPVALLMMANNRFRDSTPSIGAQITAITGEDLFDLFVLSAWMSFAVSFFVIEITRQRRQNAPESES